jgi:DNA repair protein RecN (Recombination protein N)
MLCVKVIEAQAQGSGTLILDARDTGISGSIGQAVAAKLARISRYKQVLCVSHLPQIAAMADDNYLISKYTLEGDTTTSVQALDEEGAVSEVARLTGGLNVSDHSIVTAREMREWCAVFKQTLIK